MRGVHVVPFAASSTAPLHSALKQSGCCCGSCCCSCQEGLDHGHGSLMKVVRRVCVVVVVCVEGRCGGLFVWVFPGHPCML